MLKEKDTETQQERASAILYGGATPQFTNGYDLSAYNETVNAKYPGAISQVQQISAEIPPQHAYSTPASSPQQTLSSPASAFDRYAPQPMTSSPRGAEFQQYYTPAASVFAPKIVESKIEPMEEIVTTTVLNPAADIEDNLRSEADEDIEYVVKFKTPTIICIAVIATVFILLSVLLVFNAVNIAKTNVELQQLKNESLTASQELTKAQQETSFAKQKTINEILGQETQYTATLPTGQLPTNVQVYREPLDLGSNTNVFDVICKFFSRIFR